MCIPRPRRHTTQSTSPITKLPYQRLDSPPATPRMVPNPPAVGTVAAMPTSPTRIAAPAPNPPLSSRVSSQHERLLLELLPFKDAAKFHDWLDSNFVRGPWNEFNADFLSRAIANAAAAGVVGPTGVTGPSAVPEPEKVRTAQAAREALNARKAKFIVYRPDKSAWTAEDHHVRFIVTLVADNMLQNLWYESEWKKKGLDIAKAAYEVLVFLKATMVYADPNPPSYSA
ncbi:hypothetical protein CORC01_08959 [Colletotrichum orchidophilum]|uniref:Uncharacterized protein n=1 Tax=Colletotrichum orchidophilum TaxID=1209926 RepID=A0A1G4B2X7_9PEZI|nr:uncharacterized protein CORC01_08959 [Colletotrichum orchidophilum]OHE95675.1 hypothetical protein CORC01_08959 [Colletotrichum orchidophilum]